MCGIAGAIAPPHRVDEEALRQLGTRMGAAIAHRGPDDAGTWTDAAARPSVRSAFFRSMMVLAKEFCPICMGKTGMPAI